MIPVYYWPVREATLSANGVDLQRRSISLAIASAAIAGGISRSTFAQDSEVSIRNFMGSAMKDIAKRNLNTEIKAKKTEDKGGGAAVYVRLPSVKPFGDWDFYYIDGDLRWAPPQGSTLPPVRVPKGFACDLASVPQLFWGINPPTGRYAYAAIIHDYLFWVQTTTIEVANQILYQAMRDAGTAEATVKRFQIGVGIGGQKAWDNNRTAKKNGEKRVLRQFPTDPLISWKEWKAKPGVFVD
jgi:hypothetical protein